MNSLIQFGELPLARKDQVLTVFDNRLLARKSATVTADSESPEGNFPGAKLLSENRSDYWRSDSVFTRSQQPTPEVSLKFTLGSSRDVDWVSYHWSNNNLPWRADFYMGDPDGPSTLLGTTDWMHPIVKSTLLDFAYDDFPWFLGPTDERISEMAVEMRLQSFAHLPSVLYGVDHIVIRFDVAEGENLGRDFIQVGLMFAGRAFQPTFNMSLGAALGPKDRSIKKRTAGGAAVGITRPTDAELSFVLDNLTDEEGLTQLFTNWVRREGSLARVFVYMEPASEKRLFFYDGGAFVGTLETFDTLAIDEEPGEMGGVFVAKNAKGIKIQETE